MIRNAKMTPTMSRLTFSTITVISQQCICNAQHHLTAFIGVMGSYAFQNTCAKENQIKFSNLLKNQQIHILYHSIFHKTLSLFVQK